MQDSYDINSKSELEQSGFEKFEARVLAARAKQNDPAQPSYDDWLAKGKALCEKHSNYQWAIGDWLNDGREFFDAKDIMGDVPGYLLLQKTIKSDGTEGYKGPNIPKFWEDAAAAVQVGTWSLKQFARVAAAYPKKKRFKQLSWYLHFVVCPYERRYEYLQACIGEDGQIHSGAWLDQYAEQMEGKKEACEINTPYWMRTNIPEELWRKLKDLGKYYGTRIPDLTSEIVLKLLQQYVDEQARELSLKLLDYHEPGMWPFDEIEKKKDHKTKYTYKEPRRTSAEYREKCRQGALTSWEKRRKRLQEFEESEALKMKHAKPISIRRICA